MKGINKWKVMIVAIVIVISSIFIYKGAIAPKLYDNYLNTGIKYLMDGQYEEAILAFDKAIKIDPKTTEARVYQAKAYVGNEEFDKAVNVLEEAQNIDMTNEKLLKEILDILNEIDADIAYEFLDRFIEEVGKDNLSQEINDILNSANETPREPIADPSPGRYVGPVSVKLKLDKLKVGHSYYYTLDGTHPNKGSEKYRGQIEITESTTIKLIGYNKNDESTDVITLEYIIDKNILENVKDSIVEGETLIKDTTVGTEIGNISKEDKDKLQFIVSEAKDLLNKDFIRYEDANSIKNKLENSIKEFEMNIIKPVDKSKLKSAISKAKQLHSNSTEGSRTGQYKSGSKSTLMNAINKAEEVYNNSSVKQGEVDSATSSLNSAINTFKNNKITQSNKNSDGSYTREYVKQYYKKKLKPYFTNMLGDKLIDIVVNVSGPESDHVHNNEVYYEVVYYPITSVIGDGTWIKCVNAKTLNDYVDSSEYFSYCRDL